MQKQLTVIISHEEDGYVSLCPEFDITSQGETIEEARENLREDLELFFETASSEEIQTRLKEVVSASQEIIPQYKGQTDKDTHAPVNHEVKSLGIICR